MAWLQWQMPKSTVFQFDVLDIARWQDVVRSYTHVLAFRSTLIAHCLSCSGMKLATAGCGLHGIQIGSCGYTPRNYHGSGVHHLFGLQTIAIQSKGPLSTSMIVSGSVCVRHCLDPCWTPVCPPPDLEPVAPAQMDLADNRAN